MRKLREYRKRATLLSLIGLALLAAACGSTTVERAAGAVADADAARELVALEQAALDPYYGQSDPAPYVNQFAERGTYFDPWSSGKLVDDAIGQHLLSFEGAIPLVGYDIVAPQADVYGDTAIFTFQVTTRDPENDAVLTRWNATEVRVRTGDEWKMVHAHWSPRELRSCSSYADVPSCGNGEPDFNAEETGPDRQPDGPQY